MNQQHDLLLDLVAAASEAGQLFYYNASGTPLTCSCHRLMDDKPRSDFDTWRESDPSTSISCDL
jgi:hypothetical protein